MVIHYCEVAVGLIESNTECNAGDLCSPTYLPGGNVGGRYGHLVRISKLLQVPMST